MTSPSDAALLELATSLEARRAEAVRANDVAALGALLSTELRYVHSGGKADDCASLLARMASGDLVYRVFESAIERVVGLGDDGLCVSGTVRLEATLGGQERKVSAVYLLVWRREGDAWRLVALQNTAAPVPAG